MIASVFYFNCPLFSQLFYNPWNKMCGMYFSSLKSNQFSEIREKLSYRSITRGHESSRVVYFETELKITVAPWEKQLDVVVKEPTLKKKTYSGPTLDTKPTGWLWASRDLSFLTRKQWQTTFEILAQKAAETCSDSCQESTMTWRYIHRKRSGTITSKSPSFG